MPEEMSTQEYEALTDELFDGLGDDELEALATELDLEGSEAEAPEPAPAARRPVKPARREGPPREKEEEPPILTRAQLADPRYALDPKNKRAIQEAFRDGRVEPLRGYRGG